jgi:protein TonB
MEANFARQWNPMPRMVSVVIVGLLHVGVLYALITALDKRRIEIVPVPIETNIIAEIKPPPPDLPDLPPPPKLSAPPPPYIPPPEIQIQQPPPPQTAVAVVTTVRPPAPVAPPVARVAPATAPVPDSEVSAIPIAGPPLVYPARMEQTGREGRVEIACDVDTDGATSNCAVIAALGGDAFAEAAMAYVQRARYRPAVRNGVPVREQHHKFSITFRLKG